MSWAESYGLWTDAGFKTYNEEFDDEPEENPVVLIIWTEGMLNDALSGEGDINLVDEFIELIAITEFDFLPYDNVSFHFYAKDEILQKCYRDYYEWQWINELITPEFSDLYEEILQRFVRKPDELYKLEPKNFEIFLDAIFRNNGFRTHIRSGQGDGGVDLRLYSNDVVGEVVTLVQAKRYKKDNPIRLEAVQALTAVIEDEKANRGLFVTTSRFLPSVKKFAARQQHRIQLATSEDMKVWSENAATKIIRDKSALITKDHIFSVINDINRFGVIGKVYHANTGYNMITNKFVIVLKETKGVALVMSLPKLTIKDYGHGLSGSEIPTLDESIFVNLTKDKVFRVKKNWSANNELYLWGNKNLYHQWDGSPKHFNLCD